MQLTVLGRSPAAPNPGEACSGYLIESGPSRLLMDIGPGVVAQLIRKCSPDDLEAVVISHMHSDHLLDLVTLRHSFPWLETPAHKVRVYLPPGGTEQAVDLAKAAGDASFFAKTFDVAEHDGMQELSVGPLRLQPMPTQHYVPTWGFRIVENGRTLVYSADSGPCQELLALAEEADLFLCEATLRSAADDVEDEHGRGHLTPAEAGAAAQRAGARRLLLTHLPAPDDGAWAQAQASEAFGGPAEVAGPMQLYEI